MIELITDRTQNDVDYAKALNLKGYANMTTEERAEWESGLKGTYNYEDLNRVETVTAYLAEKLDLTIAVKTDWNDWDIPKKTDEKRILDNLNLIREYGNHYSTTPETPESLSKMTYTIANDIEKILFDVRKIEPSLFRCGELFCDEV